MIMYYHENNDDYKFILMCFIDIADEVHGLTSEENDSDQNDTSCACDDPGKSFLILKSYQNCMTYEVNPPIVCVVLALDSWNYCSREQARQPNICKIPQSSLYS